MSAVYVARRSSILALRKGNPKVSARAIARQLGLHHSTVGHVLKRWGDNPSALPVDKPRSGRPAKYDARHVSASFLTTNRYKRQLVRMATKHPFWSARKLISQCNETVLKALQNRPAGAVVQVLAFISSFQCAVAPKSHWSDSVSVASQGWCLQLLGCQKATADVSAHHQPADVGNKDAAL